MSIRKAVTATLVAVSMVGAPTVAYAAQASTASIGSAQVARQGATVEDESDLRGGRGGSVIIAILAALAVIAAIVIAAGGGNNDNPNSP